MIFQHCNTKKKSRCTRFPFGDDFVAVKNEYTYLGIIFTYNCNFATHANNVVRNANLAVSAALKTIYIAKSYSWFTYKTLHQSLITSSLTYGAHIWSQNFLELIEKPYISFFKKLFRILINTPHYALRIETGIPSIRYTIFKFTIDWLIKTLGADDTRYPKLCLLRLIELSRLFPNDQYNWVNQIKHFFTTINREDIWLDFSQLQANRSSLLQNYRLYLYNNEIEKCKSSRCLKIYPHLDLPDISKPVPYICNSRYLYQLRIIAQLRFANIYYNSFFVWW